MRSSQFLSMEEVESLSTDEIIKKLRRLGVKFEKKQLLEDVHRFYSASDLADSWEAQYHIEAEGRDLDFIWLAALVLWDRLAPDVVNFEKIDAMLEEGYDLFDELKTRDACDLWLEAWDCLKELIPLKFKDIERLNEL